MSKVQAIEAAIHELSAAERAELISVLPNILPELDGDAAWNRIISSTQPNTAFSKYLDDVESQLDSGTMALRETSDTEFQREG